MKPILKKAIFFACLFLLSAFAGSRAAAQEIALKTNGLGWATLSPNLGCEFLVAEHSSIDLSAMGHINPYGVRSKIVAIQPEYRYWFNGRPMIREFIGAGVLLSTYNFTARKQVHDGDALGLGITGGYVMALSKRFNLEFSGGLCFMLYRQKQYHVDDNFDAYYGKPNQRGYKLLPMNLGVTFTYIIR